MTLSFKPLAVKDLEQLHYWFQEPVIKKLYARNQTWSLDDINHKYQPRINGEENIPSFIIELDRHITIGFIQYYSLQEYLPEGIERHNNPLFKILHSSEIAGIDMFIAEHTNRGQGLGPQIINQFITEFLMNFKLIVVDPDKNNLPAICCYEKSGFEKTDYSTDIHHLLMARAM